MARANWNTGYFQAMVFKDLLEEMDFTVELETEAMSAATFYEAVSDGKFDMWVNGWFPLHNANIRDAGLDDVVELVGSQVRGGALQGYLIDKKTADEANITNLQDLENADIAALFDSDGNGRAELIGCQEGWGCAEVIKHHLDEYALHETIEHIQGNYDELMLEAVERYENGDPIFFYTWTPNWTLGRLVPGEDVVWLEVPYASLPPEMRQMEEFTAIADIEGCASNPCLMGHPANDIRVVATQAFLETNPSARRLMELVEIPLDDIAAQNVRMMVDGEDSVEDIERHAAEWIEEHRNEADAWLADARRTSPQAVGGTLGQVRERGILLCGVPENMPGFSAPNSNGVYQGFNVDFCRVVAASIFSDTEAVEIVPLSEKKILPAVSDRKVDVVFSVSQTALRDMGGLPPPHTGISMDFGPTIYHDGQRFMVSKESGITSISGLAGAIVCVVEGTEAERNMREQLSARGIEAIVDPFDTVEVVYERYEDGRCDAVTENGSALLSHRSNFAAPDVHIVLPEQISREPLGPVFKEGDSQWKDVVSWAVNATIYAEELGINTDNIDEMFGSTNPDVQKLLGEQGTIGQEIRLESNFGYVVIKLVGNYEDIYNRNLGPGTLLSIDRGPNKPWNKGGGGVLSSPPFR
jgi:glycine betaine/proline transport system substrate-binding protein